MRKQDTFLPVRIPNHLCDLYGQYIGFGAGTVADTSVTVANSGQFSDGTNTNGMVYHTDASGFNQKTFTVSTWFYLGGLSGSIGGVGWPIFAADHGSANSETTWWKVRINTDGTLVISNWNDVVTSQVFRDIGWYHLVIGVDTTDGTAADRYKVYVNGVRVTAFGTTNYPSQDADLAWGEASEDHFIGNYDNANYAYNGYLAETVYKSGSQLDASSFGTFDSTGHYWTPKSSEEIIALSPTFYLDYSNSTLESLTSFTDRSSTGHTITVGNNVTHSQDQTKVNRTSIKFDGTTDYLKWAQSGHTDFTLGTGNFTIEGWFYRDALSGTSNYSYIMDFRYASNNDDRPAIYMDGSNNIYYDLNGIKITSSTDPSLDAWFHLAVVRNSSTTTMYLNGTSVGSFSDTVDYLVGRPWLGEYPQTNSYCWTGFMDEVRISKGNARYTANFTPSTTTHTVDSDTVFLLKGIQNYGAGHDASGNLNHFLPSSAGEATAISTHSPTNMFGLSNTLAKPPSGNISYSNSNKTVATNTSANSRAMSTVPVVGKMKMEVTINSGSTVIVGLQSITKGTAIEAYYYGSNGSVGGVSGSAGATFGASDVITMLVDDDAGTIEFKKNNTSQGGARDITASGYTAGEGSMCFEYGDGTTGDAVNVTVAVESGEWDYSDDATFLECSTNNLTAPSENDIDNYLNIQTWSGNATDGRAITTGFDTDWALIKRTNTTGHWVAADSVRGNGKSLYPHVTDAETTDDGSGHVNTFTDTGVTLDDQARTNASGSSYWGMFLKAGGAPTATNSEAQGDAPTSGSIMINGSASSDNTIGTADVTKLSVNTKLGFSVGTYNGSDSDTTLQTGLTNCKMIVIKRTNATYSWGTWMEGLTDDYNLLLDTNAAQVSSSYFDTSENTSTLFHLEGNSEATNKASGTFVFWAFANTDYIRVGSYEGNNDADGTFVYTGHRPEMVLMKSMDHSQSWILKDAVRNTYNPVLSELYPDINNGVTASGDAVDFLHNGFKFRAAGGQNSANTYVYLSIGNPSLSKGKLEMTGR